MCYKSFAMHKASAAHHLLHIDASIQGDHSISRALTARARDRWLEAHPGGTVWELAAAGLPALLVPYPHATADHQLANATYFAAAGGAVIVEDAALDGARLRDRVAELRARPGRLAEMGAGMRSVARPDAAAALANELLRLARDRK